MGKWKRKRKWIMRGEDCLPSDGEIAALSAACGLSPVTVSLLFRRGYRTAEEIKSFIRCRDAAFHSPFLLKDMDKAVARVRRAVENGEVIAIYGDYDVDGVTAVSLMYLYLHGLGANVGYYIPNRVGEGYGLSNDAIHHLAGKGVTCIITVDTGITAVEETEYAKTLGIDMVITDHHECHQILPDAVAVVNPHRADCPYPFKELAGVGVAFKFLMAYECTVGMERGEREIEGVRRIAERFADLVAIGTIADVMPVRDENRLIVALGLKQIEETERVGLKALIDEVMGVRRMIEEGRPVRRKKITSTFIGFGVAPRINAAGRMDDASIAVDLLLAQTPEEAERLALTLCEINTRRQEEENEIADYVYQRIEEDYILSNERVLVLEDYSWRQGIIGIVASRVTERYGLPSLLISLQSASMCGNKADDLGKGSGRSIKGFNLVEALHACEDLLVKYGGHELAAGLTIRNGDIPAFRKRINDYAREHMPPDALVATLEVDARLSLSDVTLKLLEELNCLEPFGVGNPVPHFILSDVRVDSITTLSGGKHLKVQVSSGGKSIQALLFSTALSDFDFVEGDRLDLLCTLDINEFRGVRTVQAIVQDFRYTESVAKEYEHMKRRYAEVKAGGSFTAEEGFLPDRADFAHVYKLLRSEFAMSANAGHQELHLLTKINRTAPRPINYVCMKYILEILNELKICDVVEVHEGFYTCNVYFNPSKTSIEKSSILKMLRGRCEGKEDSHV